MAADPAKASPLRETPFSIRVDHRREDAVLVELSGSCTMNVAGKLGDCVKGLASEGLRLIVLDMSGMDFIESTGLGGIVAGYLRIRRRHGEVRLVAPSPAIRRLLEITRLTQLFACYETVDEAFACPIR
ncbi:MAG: STAS domain-containing protein [Phycisphaerae bacterium]